MAALTEELKIRIEAETKAALERQAQADDRTPAAIARRFIREGLIRAGQLEEAVARD
jgi:predicted transcriptional regulator